MNSKLKSQNLQVIINLPFPYFNLHFTLLLKCSLAFFLSMTPTGHLAGVQDSRSQGNQESKSQGDQVLQPQPSAPDSSAGEQESSSQGGQVLEPLAMGERSAATASGRQADPFKPGDWICSNCHNHNYCRRMVCNRGSCGWWRCDWCLYHYSPRVVNCHWCK